uniref:Multidrug resistance-associated protein lethal(2)03659 n=1 Tax=Clastoptera arizonana TaxID=38151 RepID=A0A1B6DNL6_9HEMI
MPSSTVTRQEALISSAGISICSAISSLLTQHHISSGTYIGTKMKTACCSLVYRKCLRLSRCAFSSVSPGQVVNLISNDVSRCEPLAVFGHSIWSAPILSIVIAVLLYYKVGTVSFVGIAIVIVIIPFQSWSGTLNSRYRLRIARRTDERVRLMDEIISGIHVIKLYAWEKPFAQLIEKARSVEINTVRKTSYLRALYMTFVLSTTRIALFCTLVSAVLFGGHLAADKVFVMAAYYTSLTHTMSGMFVRGFTEIAEWSVSVKRLQTFLLKEEYKQIKKNVGKTKNNSLHRQKKNRISKLKADISFINESFQMENEKSISNDNNQPDIVESSKTMKTRNENKFVVQPTSTFVDSENIKDKSNISKTINLLNETSEVVKILTDNENHNDKISSIDEETMSQENKEADDGFNATLNLEEEPNIKLESEMNDCNDEIQQYHVITKNISASWVPQSVELVLNDISLNIKPGLLVGVIGPVGAGKSSLLHVLLGELPLREGTIEVNGEISYAGQEPWVFAGTVRQNILFGQPYNSSRYKAVTSACSLDKDFEHFPRGDKTIVGERGASLSGGQKARINLARAVYKEADVYLLDDPLSAVDTHIGKQLFQNCIKGILNNKTCILVTHQLQYLSRVDHLILLNNGCEKMQGTYQDLLQSDMDYAMMVMGYGLESDKPEADQSYKLPFLSSPEVKKYKTQRSQSLLSVLSRASHKSSHSESEKVELEPEVTKEMKGSVFMHYLRSGASLSRIFLIISLFLLVQLNASLCDYWVSYWTTKEETRYQLIQSGEDFHFIYPTKHYILVYAVFIILLVVLSGLRGWLFCKATFLCSKVIHKMMFNSVIGTTINFFHNNPSGRILNRFSKDLGAMDEVLPKSCIDASQIFVSALGGLMVAVAVKVWFIIPIMLMSLFCFLFRNIYIRTSKNLKRLEGIARSPVFSHLNATLQGLTTIRAQGTQNILQSEFDNHQNVHAGAMFLFAMTSGGFAYALDTLCVFYITCVAFSFLFFSDGVKSADVGLVITQSLAIAVQVEWGMKQSADVANQMTSVERVLEYASLTPEEDNKEKNITLPSAWPTKGLIEMKHVSLRYSDLDWPVLKDLNFVIQPKEKVGIVGRTGAGKTSLIAALFHLAKIDGSIYVDSVDTKTVPLETLRSRISIIPQDPVLFSGTIRMNLDPFEQFPDYVLWRVLEEVDLRESMRSTENFGLDTHVLDGGSNFSIGQRQLLCLARAILRNNNILILDEATANVDPHTDSQIQSIIRRKFSSCTVLTIAHRLHTIMDSDKVMVMDEGKIVEFDHPYVLLSKHKGYLYSLVEETGPATEKYLIEVAKTSYYRGQ